MRCSQAHACLPSSVSKPLPSGLAKTKSMPDRYRSRKSMVPASRAPGVSSVGIILAIAASTVARWCASKKRLSVMSSTSGRDGAAVVLGDRADEVAVRLIPRVLEAPAAAGVLDVGTPEPAGEPRLAPYGVARGAVGLAAGRLARQPGPVRVELGRRPVADVGDDHGLAAGLLAPTGQVVAHPDPTLGRRVAEVLHRQNVDERRHGAQHRLRDALVAVVAVAQHEVIRIVASDRRHDGLVVATRDVVELLVAPGRVEAPQLGEVRARRVWQPSWDVDEEVAQQVRGVGVLARHAAGEIVAPDLEVPALVAAHGAERRVAVPVLDLLRPQLRDVGQTSAAQVHGRPGCGVAEVDRVAEPVQRLTPATADVLLGPAQGVEAPAP